MRCEKRAECVEVKEVTGEERDGCVVLGGFSLTIHLVLIMLPAVRPECRTGTVISHSKCLCVNVSVCACV